MTKSISQKSIPELSELTYSHHRINPERGDVNMHGHSERTQSLKRKIDKEKVKKVKGGRGDSERFLRTQEHLKPKTELNKTCMEKNYCEQNQTKLGIKNKVEDILKGYKFGGDEKARFTTTTKCNRNHEV